MAFAMFKRPAQATGPAQWLAVFLGNPGSKYEDSRHNVGFQVGDTLAKSQGVKIDRLRFKALTGQTAIGGQTVLLMKPQTFMNLSGEAVGEAARFYKIPADHVLVVSDDVSLPVGKLRIRTKGSAGGHNGLKNIIAHLGTEEFPRIKVGVGAPAHPEYEMVDWVLGRFHGEDAKHMAEAYVRAAQAVETYITRGPEAAMNEFNNK